MRITYYPPSGKPRRVYGPGDLQGLDAGRVVLSGATSGDFAAYWAVPLGLFAARGGSIDWSTT